MSNFTALGLDDSLIQAVAALGYESPTEIQLQAIPQIITSERDLIALAQTGTGKTASFGLPLLHKLSPGQGLPQALILAPTRELAIQITKDFESFGKFKSRLRVEPVYGGAAISNQMRALKRGVDVVVATPGRAVDLINRGKLDLSKVRYVVLDEADEMLNMGFQEDLNYILGQTPADKQTLLFSATMAPEVSRIAAKYMSDPAEISVGTKNSGAANVSHHFYKVQARDRFEALKRIVTFHRDFYGIVFCRTRIETNDVARKLSQAGYPADSINGDLSQGQRDAVMAAFRERRIRVLVATDVAARGIDVNDLTHVINYQLPDELEAYIHRSGRTGRAGKSGVSISIIHSREFHKIQALERISKQRFERRDVPTGEQVVEAQLLDLVEQVKEANINEGLISPFIQKVSQELAEYDREELLKRFLAMEFTRLLEHYQDAPDLNAKQDRHERGDRNGKSDRGSRNAVNYTQYHLNMGAKHQLSPARLMGLINDELGHRLRFGRIDIQRKQSFFELEHKPGLDLVTQLHGADFEGVPVVVQEKAMPPRQEFSSRGSKGGRNGRNDFKKKRYPKRDRR